MAKGKEYYYDKDSGSVKERKPTKPQKSKSPTGTIRSAEFASPKLAEYESKAPSRAPGDTTQANNLGQQSATPKGSGGSGGAAVNYKAMFDALQKLSAMSQQGVNSSMDSLLGTLQAQRNPFEGFQAQRAQTVPDLAGLLQSQGVSSGPLQQFASAINAQNAGQAAAFQNLADTLGGFNTANQQGMISDVAQQRSNLLNSLQGNVLGLGSKLIGSNNADRNSITQLLLAAMKNRA